MSTTIGDLVPYASNDGVEIYYEVHGDPSAPVLMLVAGLGEQIGSVEFGLEQVKHFLAAGFRVVQVDSRDAGFSASFETAGRPDMDAALTAVMSGEAPTVPYTHFDMADDLIAIADHLGVDGVHLVGASVGGFIVRWAAIRHPDRVRSVTVVMSGSGAGFDDDGPQMDLSTLDELLEEGDHRTTDAHIEHKVELWRRYWGSAVAFDEAWITKAVTASVHRSYRPDGFLRQLTAAMAVGGLWEAQRAITQPTLVLQGTEDSVFGPDHAEGTARQIPNAKLWLVEGMGHSMPLEIWEDMATRIASLTATA